MMDEKNKFNCEALVRQIPDPLLVFSKTGKILIASHSFEEVSGYKSEEVEGKNAFLIGMVTKESLSVVKKNLLRRFLGKKLPLYDVKVKIKDGTILITEVNGAVVNFNGTKAVLTVFRDVTEERKKMEEKNNKLKEATEKLEQKLSELKKMNELMVGRELKMVELKEKIEKFKKQ